MTIFNKMRHTFQFAAWVTGITIGLSGYALAAVTDLGTAPLAYSTTTQVKPNLMFMLDDSGSMAWDYLPDAAQGFSGKYGFNSSHCNGIYYNPNITYTPPVKSDGTSYANSSFTAAWTDGFAGTGSVNLNTQFKGGSGSGQSGASGYSGGVAAFYYTYSGTQNTSAQMNYFSTGSQTFNNECNSSIGSAPGNAVFTKNTLSSTVTTTITISNNVATITITCANGTSSSCVTSGGSATNATIVSGITVPTMVAGTLTTVQILSTATGSSSNPSTVATLVASYINNCTAAVTGNCTLAGGTGYSAIASGNVVTLYGPADFVTPSIYCNGTATSGACGGTHMIVTPTTFPNLLNTQITSITVNGGANILSASTTTASNSNDLADYTVAKVSTTGYSATSSSNVVTLTGPSSASGYTPVITACSTQAPIACYTTPSAAPSGVLGISVNPFPTLDATKLTNFANWFSYYSNRMLMMKTGVGLAFKPVTSNYRVGFMSMNNNVSPGFADTLDFTGGCAVGSNTCQRDKWYTKLYAASANNSTPLREALSHVGQYYAHKFNGAPYYTSTITISGSGSTIVDSVKVAATGTLNDAATGALKDELLNAATPLDSDTTSLASDIANQINAMVTTDYGATSSANVVTVYGPAAANGKTPVIVDTGGMTETATAFSAHTAPTTLNGVTPLDPMQYSCQQNFVILSTDGYWNGSYTYDLAGTANGIGNQDGTETRTPPRLDGTTTANTLADVAEYYYNTDLRDISLTNCTGALGTDVCTDNVPTSSLDPQKQQHMTTFTLGLGARGRMVFDPAWDYISDKCLVINTSNADYCAIYNGSTASSTVCTWQTSGVCNWPVPNNNSVPANIDDLWHASINGHGTYFSATDPATLATGLYSALTGINARVGSAAAAATSSPNLTQTSHTLFASNYETSTWDGDVKAEVLDPATGQIIVDTTNFTVDPITGLNIVAWSAQSKLDTLVQTDCATNAATPTCLTPDISVSRHIYTFDIANASGNNLKSFLFGNLTSTGSPTEQSYFTSKCTGILSQCTTINLGAANLTIGDSGTNLVNWLRGNQWYESPTPIYRSRSHILGDSVDAKPIYVKFPIYNFSDTGYNSYITTQTALPRTGMLYTASNDGMLHAFVADTYNSNNVTLNTNGGKEAWAYIPRMVMPNLYKLADAQYATNHQYYVDGSPEVMDIYQPSATAVNNLAQGWHTILVGGLGGGGQGFYALDVTNPSSPNALWEFCSSSTLCPTISGIAHSDTDMGYSYGNPVITKRSTDGKWVVLLTSGYNNTGGPNPGQGFLYELDAVTGQLLHKTSTGTSLTTNTVAPSATSPTGLAKISAWFDNSYINMQTRFIYGGDLNGDVWRFDLGAVGATEPALGTITARTVTRLASLVDDASTVCIPAFAAGPPCPQSITTRPQLADPLNNVTNSLTGTGNPAVFVATGRYLGLTDLTNYQVQSVYGIKDNLSQTSASSPTHYYGNPRTYAGTLGSFVKQYIYQPTSATNSTYSATAMTRTTSTNAVDWTVNSGWYADFEVYLPTNIAASPSPSPGERVNIDPLLINTALLVGTNVPTASSCDVGGMSWMYTFNFLNGQYIPFSGNTNVATMLQVNGKNSLLAGFTIAVTTGGKPVPIDTNTGGTVTIGNSTIPPISTHRTSWIELTQ